MDNLLNLNFNFLDNFLNNWDGDDLVNVFLDDLMNFNKLRNNGFKLDDLLFLNHLFNDLFNFNDFGHFNDFLDDLLDNLLNWDLFSNGFFLRYDNLFGSWDLNDFLLNYVFFLVDNLVLNNFDNLVNNSFNFLYLGVLRVNLNNLFNNLLNMNNLFLDVRNSNWFFNDLFNLNWNLDSQDNWLFNFDEDLSLNDLRNNLFNDNFLSDFISD